jgi:hypothetical protein
VQASWAFVGGSLFNAMHVSACGWVIMREFDNTNLGAVLECLQSLSRNLPIDRSESAE